MPPQIEVELMKLMFCRNINWTVDCPTPRGVTLYITLGGQLLRKLGKVQAPKDRSSDCRRQEASHD